MINKKNLKVFILSLVLQLGLTSLINLGVGYPDFLKGLKVSPLIPTTSKAENDNFKQIADKLVVSKDQLKLKKPGVSVVSKAHASGEFDNAHAYIVVNLDDGQVLAEKDSSKKIPIASLTKIMTSIVALDLSQPDEWFTITSRAANQIPTKIGVVAGERMRLSELLNAMILTSANDATEAVKDGIDKRYGYGIFIKAMNTKAVNLGLKNTHFDNPQGFDSDGQYSSAEDLSILSQYALVNYPLISQIAKKDYQFLPKDGSHKQFDLYNWNGLLDVYPGVYGLKIGNTEDAGFTTIVASQRQGKKVLVVLLGAPGVLERDMWASQLLDLGFEKEGLSKVSIDESQLKAKYSTWKYWG